MKAGINVHFEGIRHDGSIDREGAHGHNLDEFGVGNALAAEDVVVGRGQARRVGRAVHRKLEDRAGARRFNRLELGAKEGHGGGVHT